jgi:hypothetical protein
MPVDLLANICNKLVGQVEDENGGVLDGGANVRVGDNVGRQGDAWQILDVLVMLVDHLGELLRLVANRFVIVLGVFGDGHVFLIDPHLDLFLEDVFVCAGVLGKDFGNR